EGLDVAVAQRDGERAEAARLVDLREQEILTRAPPHLARGAGADGEPFEQRLGEGSCTSCPVEGHAALLVERLEQGDLLVAVARDERRGEGAEPVFLGCR